MNDMLSLQKEARNILREVLNQKDIAIKELTKQIIDYRTEIIKLGQKFQNYQRQQAQQIDYHNIQALMNAGFIINEDSQFHIMIDITQVIHQRSQILRLDSRVQIIKEVNKSLNISNHFIDLYQGLRNENNILAKILSDKDMEYQYINESFKKQMKDNSDEYQRKLAQLQQTIQKIQQQKEMIELESQQILSEKSNYRASKDEFKDRYQQTLKQCDIYRIKLNDIAENNQKIRKQNIEIQVKLKEIIKKYQQLIEQKQKIRQKKEEEIDLQHNKFVTSFQDNESFSKLRQDQQDQTKQKQKILKLSQKKMTLQSQCFNISMKPNIFDAQKKVQNHLGAQNMMVTQLKVDISPQKSTHKDKKKQKKMIRIGY